MPSIYSRIISGEMPSFKLYEDEYTYAFLDIFPQHPGHTLIVPKIEVDHFADVPEPYYSAIFQAAKILAPAIKAATGCNRVCSMFGGYEIQHCHYHVFSTQQSSDLNGKSNYQASPEDLKSMQEKILSHLKTHN